jgi:putative ABC transport system substrate-binding protein
MILTGCGQPASEQTEKPAETTVETTAPESEQEFKIGISQLVEHPALDASRQGFIDGLKELGVNVVLDEKNAQGDVANAQIIAEKFVKDDVDLIFTIATLTSQAAKKAIEGTDIPMVFTAVTDPVFSQLVSDRNTTDNNITGVDDAAPIKENLELFTKIKEDIKAIGIIYNTGESNSEVQVNQAKEIAKEMGITIETVGITTVNDIPQAMNTIAKKADGLYIITDNLVASSISLVAKLAEENKLITVSADSSTIEEGIMMAEGISFYGIGKQSAVMVKKILVDKIDIKDIPVESAPEFEIKVNIRVMESLGLTKDNKAFEGAEFID